MSQRHYPASFIADEVGGYAVSFPDWPGVFSQGETAEEARRMAEEALALAGAERVSLPDPSPISAALVEGTAFVALVPLVAPPPAEPSRRRYNVMLDPALVARIDAVSGNRSHFLEKAALEALTRRP